MTKEWQSFVQIQDHSSTSLNEVNPNLAPVSMSDEQEYKRWLTNQGRIEGVGEFLIPDDFSEDLAELRLDGNN